MGKQNKIFKWIMLALMFISLLIVVLGSLKGYPDSVANDNGTVDPLLYWTYVMIGIAVVCAVLVSVFIMAANNPKSLVKLGIGLVVVAVICGIAYALAPGSQPLAYNGEPVTNGTLKLTDTVLNLTWFAGAAAILSIIVGEIASKVRKN
ncbi:MAG: hypothetical protein IJ151_00230 [Bacteroidales bacterium]|nr:hypothetical protein [Bacteroidales bacterium]